MEENNEEHKKEQLKEDKKKIVKSVLVGILLAIIIGSAVLFAAYKIITGYIKNKDKVKNDKYSEEIKQSKNGEIDLSAYELKVMKKEEKM